MTKHKVHFLRRSTQRNIESKNVEVSEKFRLLYNEECYGLHRSSSVVMAVTSEWQ